jgi:NADPH2:quinone reductase
MIYRKDVMDWLQQGIIKVHIGKKFALKDSIQAHKALEGRSTTGKVLLQP